MSPFGFKEVNLFVGLLGALAILAMLLLSSCGHNSEEDLWKVWQHVEQQR